MHDRGALIPVVIISPRRWSVAQTLKLLKDFKLYNQLPVSVKSGGHRYFNGASCSGVIVSLASMTGRRAADNTLFLEPGCVLGQTVYSLARHRKAVPYGDCFGVGAGGHFLTAI
jgi:FAD/FMN-containing dehydrogenase